MVLSLIVGAPAALAAPQSSAADLFESARVDFLDSNHRLEIPADLDGDGHPELVGWWSPNTNFDFANVHFWKQDLDSGAWVKGEIFLNTGGGAYMGATDTVAGDFDGDGRDEVLILHRNGWEVLEADAGNVPVHLLSMVPTPALSGSVRRAAVLDMNGDGLDDIAIVDGAQVRLYLAALSGGSPGNLHFTLADAFSSYGGEVRLASFDVTGTATAELILLQDHAHPAVWTLNVEGGTVQSSTRIFARATNGGERIDLAPGDLDDDGDMDAVLFGHDGRYQVLRNQGGELLLESDQPGGPATALADLDGDGDLDGICCGGSGSSQYNTGPSIFHLSLNQGAEDFEPAIAFPGLGAHHVAGAVDFDRDGDMDVIAGRSVILNAANIGTRFCGATLNSTGLRGEIHVDGRASVAAGGPEVRVTDLPAGTTCILLCSGSMDPVVPWAFWDGQLCLGTHQLRRLKVAMATTTGAADLGGIPDWSTGGFGVGSTPGEPFTYQVWFRDVGPAGSGANVTNAARILLTH